MPLADFAVLLAIQNKSLGYAGMPLFNQNLFNKILYVFDSGNTSVFIDNIKNTDNGAGHIIRLLRSEPPTAFAAL